MIENERKLTTEQIITPETIGGQVNKRGHERFMSKLIQVLLVPDMHIPHQDKLAVKTLFNFIKDNEFEKTILFGDLIDFVGVSRFRQNSDPREQRNIQEEIEETQEFLDDLRGAVSKKSQITYLEGNHEFRLNKFLYKEAPALVHLKKDDEDLLSVPYLLNLKQRKIDYIPSHQSLNLYGWNAEHGEKISQYSAYSAKKMVDSRRVNTLMGHSHRMGVYFYTSLSGVQQGIELGCLIDPLSPAASYTKHPNWQLGFGMLTYDSQSKQSRVDLMPMENHKFIWQGKVYKP